VAPSEGAVAPGTPARERARTAARRGAAAVRTASGSVWAAVAIVVVFTAQASLLAFTMVESRYDETYHRAAIGYFASGGSPFGTQAATLTGVGDVERYGSYLYHLLMSVPYRWTEGLPLETRVAVLRLITVLMVAGGLLAVRRLGRVLGLPGFAANVVVLVVAAVPMTTFLAVTVNYDNLVFLLLPLMWIAAVRLLRADRVDGYGWSLFLMSAALLSISKFSALPLVAVTGIWVLVQQLRVGRRRAAWGAWRWRPLPVAAAAGALVAVAVVVERYGVNLVRYRAVQPDCGDIHPTRICMAWGPWGRNAALDAAYPDDPASLGGLLSYVSYEWHPRLMSTWTLFPVATPEGTLSTFGPHVVGLLLVLSVLGVLALVAAAPRAALSTPGAAMLLVASAGYLAAMLAQNYADFRVLGEPVAVQGRYLQLLLAPMLILAARSFRALLVMNGGGYATAMRVVAGVLLVTGLSQSAGLIGILSRSEPEWFRETRLTPVVLEVREAVRGIVVDDAVVREIRPYTG
jgi:hypothetical protein